jgi:hypothetical protein
VTVCPRHGIARNRSPLIAAFSSVLIGEGDSSLGHSLYPIAIGERTLHSLTSKRKYLGITILSGYVV